MAGVPAGVGAGVNWGKLLLVGTGVNKGKALPAGAGLDTTGVPVENALYLLRESE